MQLISFFPSALMRSRSSLDVLGALPSSVCACTAGLSNFGWLHIGPDHVGTLTDHGLHVGKLVDVESDFDAGTLEKTFPDAKFKRRETDLYGIFTAQIVDVVGPHGERVGHTTYADIDWQFPVFCFVEDRPKQHVLQCCSEGEEAKYFASLFRFPEQLITKFSEGVPEGQ